jgi:hypothetical protein
MESQTGNEVTAILVDRNIEGQAVMLWGTLAAGGWLELLPMTMARFVDVGLPFDSSDRTPASCWAVAYRRRHVVKRFSKYPSGLAIAQVSFHQSRDDLTRRF